MTAFSRTRTHALLTASVLLQLLCTAPVHAGSVAEQRMLSAAANTRIVRDDWGIAHVHGKSDADAVFGMIYAQAEDDFNRVETNYLNSLGRLAEAEGEGAVFQDLRMRLFISPAVLKKQYAASPAWLKDLMTAWADGLNFYLRSHPAVKPRVLRKFEPWMALSFSEGSIGGDIERVPLDTLAAFYGAPQGARTASTANAAPQEPKGSNGFAIAPANTKNHHALLLINPHTSFFFRSELQATSDAGLNAYGAATWGQFFLYQGFNERLGWMHTSSGVDAVDFFLETIVKKHGRFYYRYGSALRPLEVSNVRIAYRNGRGARLWKSFTVYRSHHGPIIEDRGGKWLSIALMQKPIEALSQSFLLTKAKDYAGFMKVMQLRANSSNNTIYADADGNIAYLHPQFIPRRNDHFDYTQAVDGADPATDWQGLHTLDEAPHLLNPPNGWIMNTNNWPYSAAGPNSPRREDYPRYMDTVGETPRGLHATLVLEDRKDFTQASLNAAAFDSYLPAFARLLPTLTKAYDALAADDALKSRLAAQIEILRDWDYRWAADSVATTLACLWGDALWHDAEKGAAELKVTVFDFIAEQTSGSEKLAALAGVVERLEHDFGNWRVAWGEINRFQRLSDDIAPKFTDAGASVPIAFTSARWGSLASFGARRYEGTNKYYGTGGNSFVAIVEFGDRVSARAVSTGGASGDPASPHFNDQTPRYADEALREVYFYPEQLAGHTERDYHPQ